MLQLLATWLVLLALLLVLTCGAIKSSSCLMVLLSPILMKMLLLIISRVVWLKLVSTNGVSRVILFPYFLTHILIAAVNDGKLPKVMVMGALGRCGTGACDFARKAGIPEENIIKWDINETKGGGPFPQILEAGKLLKGCYMMGDSLCVLLYRYLCQLYLLDCQDSSFHYSRNVGWSSSTFCCL